MGHRPNILVVMADQFRAASLGILGEDPVHTPHLDRLAQQGCLALQAVSGYEECVRVPLIVSGRGVVPGTRADPVSAGLDVLPTLLEVAGMPAPAGLHGRPLPVADDADEASDRVVGVETRFERADPPLTRGRAVYRGRYKYAVYSWGRYREQLHDVIADPGERRNLAVESAFDAVREQMRACLLQWCLDSDDHEFLKLIPLPADAPEGTQERILAVPY